MATMTLQSFHRPERILRAFDELSCRDVPKVICRKIREEGQAHIRRRCPMTDDGHRIFLKVVWRQPVIFGTDERLEECPRSEEHTSELQSRLHLVCRLLLE